MNNIIPNCLSSTKLLIWCRSMSFKFVLWNMPHNFGFNMSFIKSPEILFKLLLLCHSQSHRKSVADLRGCEGCTPPWGPNSFNFMQFLGKYGKSYVGAPLGSWRPVLGEILDPPLEIHSVNNQVSWNLVAGLFHYISKAIQEQLC